MEQVKEKTFIKKVMRRDNDRAASKAEALELANIIRSLKEMNKNYTPFKNNADKIDSSMMTKIGGRVNHVALFKRDQAVVFRGQRMWVSNIIEPNHFEPHLLEHLRDHGYSLRLLNEKKPKLVASESELKTLEEAVRLGLLG